jgi:hypothetical protein
MGNLKSFKIFYEEVVKPIVVTFGRFNPPTIGHEKLLNAVASTAGKKPYRIYVSQSQDKKKNPLPYDEKIKFLRKMFPRYARNIIDDASIKTIFDIAVKLNTEGFTHFILVVGSDRVSNFKELLDKYNGVKAAHGEYKFESIEVVSAGERDPDSDEVSAMSATKLRAAAAEGDLSAFSKGLPNGFGDVQDLFNAVRKGMGLEEMVQFRRHIELPSISEIRNLYVKGEIFQEGTKVTHGGSTYTVNQRKTNFIVCISEKGETKKFWLDQITPLNEEVSYVEEESYEGNSFFEKYGILEFDVKQITEGEYQGRKVELNKPMQGDVKKFKVYVKNKEGKVVKINFGDPNMTIKKHIPARRKSFRARHKCDTDPADRDTARYWSCKKW